MPRKPKEKVVTKLVNYIKKDRPRKFKACVKKYDVDLQLTALPKGRTLLHCASKHGSGQFVSYLLAHGVLASQADNKGDLPLHLALDRALQIEEADSAAEVYNNIVVPLLKNFPDALYFCDHRGTSVSHLLAMLNRHLMTANDSDSESDSSSSDSEWSDTASTYSSVDDFSERLAQEFESESAEFFGRYSYSDAFDQESQTESYMDWYDRMEQEHRRKHGFCHHHHPHHHHPHSHPHTSIPSDSRKRKYPGARPKPAPRTHHPNPPPRSNNPNPGINIREEIHKAKCAQNMAKLRASYEERFQAILNDKSDRKLSYADIPWPSKGSLDHVMEVLFGDKTHLSVSELKKTIREQQVRWHPDKFLQKFIGRIAPKSFEKVMERVKEISQAINKKAESLSSG